MPQVIEEDQTSCGGDETDDEKQRSDMFRVPIRLLDRCFGDDEIRFAFSITKCRRVVGIL
jgi:hypothetical protein